MFRWKDLKMDFEYTAESTDGTNTALQTVVCWLQCNGSICSCVCRRITNVCGVPTYQCLLISQGWIPSSLISPQSVEGVEECVKEHRWLCGLRWIVSVIRVQLGLLESTSGKLIRPRGKHNCCSHCTQNTFVHRIYWFNYSDIYMQLYIKWCIRLQEKK